MGAKRFAIVGKKWKGYSDDATNADAETLCPPSVNVSIDKQGVARTRMGFRDTGINLNQAGKASRPFHVPAFDITFHAIGTKVLYVDHNNADAVVDTGITLTNGTISRFEEHNGVVYVTNSTDGAYGFLLTRLNGAVTLGASTITTDVEGGAIANVFDTELSPGTRNLRINGTNEAYSAAAVTGVFTLSGTASAGYADNAIAMVVYDLTARFPKCDKIVAWKEALHFVGLSVDTGNVFSSDRRQTTLSFTQSATAATSENVLKVTGGTAGAEMVGKSGKLVNALATRDYLYLLKDTAIYYIKVSDINLTTGARPPQVLSENYGGLNADCAVDMGNGEVAFITSNNRIIRIKISSESGAPVVFPDESFDTAYANTLPMMNQLQTDSQMFYDPQQKRAFVQLTLDGNALTLPYNNEIGAWEPPRNGYFFKGYYVRKANGILYGTDRNDDTIYELDNTLDDDGLAIECVMASPILEFEDGRVTCKFDQLELSGSLTENAEIIAEMIVNRGTPQQKTIDSTGVSFNSAPSLGSVVLGSTELGGGILGSEMGDFDARLAIYPSLGSDLQIVLSTTGEGQAFAWKSYSIKAKALSKSSITLS